MNQANSEFNLKSKSKDKIMSDKNDKVREILETANANRSSNRKKQEAEVKNDFARRIEDVKARLDPKTRNMKTLPFIVAELGADLLAEIQTSEGSLALELIDGLELTVFPAMDEVKRELRDLLTVRKKELTALEESNLSELLTRANVLMASSPWDRADYPVRVKDLNKQVEKVGWRFRTEGHKELRRELEDKVQTLSIRAHYPEEVATIFKRSEELRNKAVRESPAQTLAEAYELKTRLAEAKKEVKAPWPEKDQAFLTVELSLNTLISDATRNCPEGDGNLGLALTKASTALREVTGSLHDRSQFMAEETALASELLDEMALSGLAWVETVRELKELVNRDLRSPIEDQNEASEVLKPFLATFADLAKHREIPEATVKAGIAHALSLLWIPGKFIRQRESAIGIIESLSLTVSREDY